MVVPESPNIAGRVQGGAWWEQEEGADSVMCMEVGWNGTWHRPLSGPSCLIRTAPSLFVRAISAVVVGLPLGGSCSGACRPEDHMPYDPTKRRFGQDYPPFGYTMIGMTRLENIRAAIDDVNRNGVVGDVVEIGVWRGGCMLLAAAVCTEASRSSRPPPSRGIHLFDAFGPIDDPVINMRIGTNQHIYGSSVEDAQQLFKMFGLAGPHIHFHKGLFNETIPEWARDNRPIAVLRLDGNLWQSHQDALYFLYETVPVGGIVIFDDATSPEVMECWLNFKKDQGLTEELHLIDQNGGWFRKQKLVMLDWTFYLDRAPPMHIHLGESGVYSIGHINFHYMKSEMKVDSHGKIRDFCKADHVLGKVNHVFKLDECIHGLLTQVRSAGIL